MSFANQQLSFELLNTSSIARIIKIANFVGVSIQKCILILGGTVKFWFNGWLGINSYCHLLRAAVRKLFNIRLGIYNEIN